MTFTAFPAGLEPSEMKWGLIANTQSGGRSPLDGTEQTLLLPGARWGADLAWRGLPEAEWRALAAFLAGLGGRAGRFTLAPLHAPRRATGFAGRVNWVHNSEFSGAGVGVLPATWELTPANGITGAVTGAGTDGNGTWIEVTFSGTPVGTFVGLLRTTAATAAPAAVGQDWTAALSLQTQGSPSNIASIRPSIYGVDAGTYATAVFGTGTIAELTAVTRRSVTTTLTVAAVAMGVDIRGTAGVPCSVVLRVWQPHLNRGASAEAYVASTSGPAYAAAGPYVNGAGQTGASLSTRGWQPGAQAFLAGDFLGFVGPTGRPQLHQVTADATAGATGIAAVPIAPPLRRSPADGAVVTIDAPTAVFRLTDDDDRLALSNSALIGEATVRIEEAIFA